MAGGVAKTGDARMVMALKDFHKLSHDVVGKISVQSHTDPGFVVMTIHHGAPSSLVHKREMRKKTVLLTVAQAKDLATHLTSHCRQAKSHEKHRSPSRKPHM